MGTRAVPAFGGFNLGDAVDTTGMVCAREVCWSEGSVAGVPGMIGLTMCMGGVTAMEFRSTFVDAAALNQAESTPLPDAPEYAAANATSQLGIDARKAGRKLVEWRHDERGRYYSVFYEHHYAGDYEVLILRTMALDCPGSADSL